MSVGTDSAGKLSPTPEDLEDLEAVYKDLHEHPELSMQEHRTAGIVAKRMKALGYEVTEGVGGTGVVCRLENGDGPVVMCRADMDALPVKEATGLPYASTATGTDRDGNEVPVAHACGHDMHTTWMLGAAKLMVENRDAWSGTFIPLFQPGEEIAAGAQAMIDDGLFKRFPKPEVIIAQHTGPAPAGRILYRPGAFMAAEASYDVRLFGRGGHGSMPDHTIDPVVMAAATVMRLQTIVAREITPGETAVVTVGAIQAGEKSNIIPDEALVRVNIRAFDDATITKLTDAIKRIADAEAAASGAPKPPDITQTDITPVLLDDPDWTARLTAALSERFGNDWVTEIPALTTSEDFGLFGGEWGVPGVYWNLGVTERELFAKAAKAGTVAQDVPTNHSPNFAPVIHPSLEIGIEAMVTAALRGLARSA